MENSERPQYNTIPIAQLVEEGRATSEKHQKFVNGAIIGAVIGAILLLASGGLDKKNQQAPPPNPDQNYSLPLNTNTGK